MMVRLVVLSFVFVSSLVLMMVMNGGLSFGVYFRMMMVSKVCVF